MAWFLEAVDGVFNTACLRQDHGLLALCCDNMSGCSGLQAAVVTINSGLPSQFFPSLPSASLSHDVEHGIFKHDLLAQDLHATLTSLYAYTFLIQLQPQISPWQAECALQALMLSLYLGCPSWQAALPRPHQTWTPWKISLICCQQ